MCCMCECVSTCVDKPCLLVLSMGLGKNYHFFQLGWIRLIYSLFYNFMHAHSELWSCSSFILPCPSPIVSILLWTKSLLHLLSCLIFVFLCDSLGLTRTCFEDVSVKISIGGSFVPFVSEWVCVCVGWVKTCISYACCRFRSASTTLACALWHIHRDITSVL